MEVTLENSFPVLLLEVALRVSQFVCAKVLQFFCSPDPRWVQLCVLRLSVSGSNLAALEAAAAPAVEAAGKQ